MEYLDQDEQMIQKAVISRKRLVPLLVLILPCFLLAILILFMEGGAFPKVFIWLCFLAALAMCVLDQILKEKFDILCVTTKRVFGKTGLLKINSMDSPLNKVNNVVVEENIFGKMLGYGTIRITTSSGEHVFHGVDHPVQLKGVIMSEIQHNKEYDMRKQADAAIADATPTSAWHPPTAPATVAFRIAR